MSSIPAAVQQCVAEQCWCGATSFSPSPHPDYLVCQTCGTAKLRSGLAVGQDAVTDEQSHLYGEHYWNEHMLRQGYPPLAVRARADLAERCQYWLKHLLKYQLPPARTLEIGCAHGGFVKVLKTAGFDTLGMEMSPGVVAKAEQWFGVEVARGPIEQADRPIGMFDVILMFDVIEHFAAPLTTMKEITARISGNGLLVLQTPVYDDVTDRTWHQFKPPEHTFLFSRQSIKRFLADLGFVHTAMEPNIFPSDMFVFASRRPLVVHSAEEIAERLTATPDGRIALAMQDLYAASRLPRASDLSQYYGARQLGSSFFRALGKAITRRLGLRK